MASTLLSLAPEATGAESSRDEFFAALRNELGLDLPPDLLDDQRLDELGWDSLTLAELGEWAQVGGVRLEDEMLSEIRTVGDLWAWVGAHMTRDDGLLGATADPFELLPVGPRHEDLLISWLMAPGNLKVPGQLAVGRMADPAITNLAPMGTSSVPVATSLVGRFLAGSSAAGAVGLSGAAAKWLSERNLAHASAGC